MWYIYIYRYTYTSYLCKYIYIYIYIGAFAIKHWKWITQPQEKGTASQASQTGLECVHISALVGFIGWVRLRDWNYQPDMPWKRIKHLSLVTHLRPSFFPISFHLTWDLNIYNCHLECIKKSSNLVFVSIVGLQI